MAEKKQRRGQDPFAKLGAVYLDDGEGDPFAPLGAVYVGNEAALPAEGPSFGESLIRGSTVSDELEALVNTVVKPGMFDDLGKAPTPEQQAAIEAARRKPVLQRAREVFGKNADEFEHELDASRARQREAAAANPKTATTGRILESLLVAPLAPGGVVAQSAILGAGQEVADSERRDMPETLKALARGGLLGAAGGALAKGGGALLKKGAEMFRRTTGEGAESGAKALRAHADDLDAKATVKRTTGARKEAEEAALSFRDAHPLNPKIEAARQAVKDAERRAADLVLAEQKAAEAVVKRQGGRLKPLKRNDANTVGARGRGQLPGEQELDEVLRQQTRNRAALEEAQRTLDALMEQRRLDPAWQALNRQKWDLGQELKKARGRSARAERIASETPGAEALGEAQRLSGGLTAKLGAMLGALGTGDPVVGAALLGARWAVNRALSSPATARKTADALMHFAQRSPAMTGYLAALTDGLAIGTAAGAREFIARHAELMETDPAYRETFDSLDVDMEPADESPTVAALQPLLSPRQ